MKLAWSTLILSVHSHHDLHLKGKGAKNGREQTNESCSRNGWMVPIDASG
jgi:hypothetical protein